MNLTEQILLAGLSVALLVFLVLAIVIAVLVLRLLKTAKRLSEKLDGVMTSAESVGETLRNAAGPLAMVKIIAGMARNAKRK